MDNKNKHNIGNYTLPGSTTEQSPGRRSKIEEFLDKKDDDATKKLKAGETLKMDEGTSVDEYAKEQKQQKIYIPLMDRAKTYIEKRFQITMKNGNIKVWKNRKFDEFLFIQVPRFLFLVYTCFICYKIHKKYEETKVSKSFVRSQRQEALDTQLKQINKVLGQENTFDPSKKTVTNTGLGNANPSYLHEKEEQELQDQLFKLYDVLQDDYDKSVGKD